tara:strand:- start:826 stop:1059 length:234 start_codon:yes stop_codon:yes gene_type:complete
MILMVWYHPKYYAELRKKRRELQATSGKQQAIDETVPHCDIEEATSGKRQAVQASSGKLQAPSNERQASSRKRQASE